MAKTLRDVKNSRKTKDTKDNKTITDADYLLRDKTATKDKSNTIYMPGTENAQEFRERIAKDKKSRKTTSRTK